MTMILPVLLSAIGLAADPSTVIAAPKENAAAVSAETPQRIEHASAASTDKGAMAVAEAAAAAAREAAEATKRLANVVQQLVEKRALLEGYEPAASPALSPWSYVLGLSALAIGGNANTYSSKLDIGVDGHWRDWNAELRMSGSYGQTSPTVDSELQINASKGEATLRGQRNYNPVLGIYLLGGGMFDRVASIAWQGYGESGISLLWWEHINGDFLRSRLRTSLGFRATREHRFQFYPDPLELDEPYRSIYGPTVTANFRFGMSRAAYFFEDAAIYQDAVTTADTRVTSSTGITAQINQRVSLSVTYKVRY